MKDIEQIIREELQKVVTEETSMIQKGTEGDCYKNVQDYLLDNDIPNAIIVHGVVTSRNGTLNHAWIETDTEVYDPTTGIKTDKETYYRKLNPKVEARYTFEEAMKKRFSQGNFGPWTEMVNEELEELLGQKPIHVYEETENFYPLETNVSLVTEVGEASASPYNWRMEISENMDGEIYRYEYYFTTEDNDKYTVEILSVDEYENEENAWALSFDAYEYGHNQVVNKGRLYKVMSTILNVIRDFMKREDPYELIFEPTKKEEELDDEGNKRLALYMQYIKKNMPINYYVTVGGTKDLPEVIIRKKAKLGAKNPVNEVGEGTAKAYRIYEDYLDTLYYGHAQFHFITESNRKHTLKFKSSKLIEYDEWTVTFKESSGGIAYDKPTEFTGGTNVYRIFATYLEIIDYFIALQNPDILAFLNFGEQKYNIFMQYLKKNIPMDYEISDNDKYDFLLVRKDFEEHTDHLLENIIADEINNPDFKNSMMTDKSIIGKRVGDVFQGFDGIEPIANKTITYAKLFKGEDEFLQGLHNAEDFLRSEGYNKGRIMEQGNFPIPFIKKGKLKQKPFYLTGKMVDVIPTNAGKDDWNYFYDTGWDELTKESIELLDGVILSEDFDHKELYVIFFEFPMNESKKKKKKQLTMALPIGKIFSAGIGENKQNMETHIMTKEEFTKIVNEELNNLNEQYQILTIRDLAELGARTGYDYDTFLEIYQDAFRRGGDEEVVKVAESMLKQKLYVLSKGKYSLTPLTGGEY